MRPVLITRRHVGLGDLSDEVKEEILGFVQKAIADSINNSWPIIYSKVQESIPLLVEDFKPHIPGIMEQAKPAIQKQFNRAALMIGGITVGAVVVTALVCRKGSR